MQMTKYTIFVFYNCTTVQITMLTAQIVQLALGYCAGICPGILHRNDVHRLLDAPKQTEIRLF